MEVRFFHTGDDFWKFQKYNRSRPRRRLQLILICLISACFGVWFGLVTTSAILMPFFSLVGIAILVVGWSTWRTHRKVVLHLAKEGEQIITITPESFRERTLISDTILSWKAFKVITADKHNLYFFLDSPTVKAYVIPQRAFAAFQDAETFLAWANSYWANGNSTPQAGTPGSATGYERWG